MNTNAERRRESEEGRERLGFAGVEVGRFRGLRMFGKGWSDRRKKSFELSNRRGLCGLMGSPIFGDDGGV